MRRIKRTITTNCYCTFLKTFKMGLANEMTVLAEFNTPPHCRDVVDKFPKGTSNSFRYKVCVMGSITPIIFIFSHYYLEFYHIYLIELRELCHHYFVHEPILWIFERFALLILCSQSIQSSC